MKLDYLLTGTINGWYTEIRGQGDIDQKLGEFSLELDMLSVPKGWDPAIIALMCCDNLRLFSADMSKTKELSTARQSLGSIKFGNEKTWCREGFMLAPDGTHAAVMRAKGFLLVEDGVVRSRTALLDGCFSKLNQFGGVRRILTPYTEILTPTVPGCAMGVSGYRVECRDGTILTGSTNYPYFFDVPITFDRVMMLKVTEASINSIEYLDFGVTPRLNLKIESCEYSHEQLQDQPHHEACISEQVVYCV